MLTIDNTDQQIAGSERDTHCHGQDDQLKGNAATTTISDDDSDTMDVDSDGSSCAVVDITHTNGATSVVAGLADSTTVDDHPISQDDAAGSVDADFVWSEDESEDNHLWPVGIDANHILVHGDETTIPAIDRHAMAILVQEIMQDLGAPIGRGAAWQMTKNALGALHVVTEDYMSAVFCSADLVRQASGDGEMQPVDLHAALQIIGTWSNTRSN